MPRGARRPTCTWATPGVAPASPTGRKPPTGGRWSSTPPWPTPGSTWGSCTSTGRGRAWPAPPGWRRPSLSSTATRRRAAPTPGCRSTGATPRASWRRSGGGSPARRRARPKPWARHDRPPPPCRSRRRRANHGRSVAGAGPGDHAGGEEEGRSEEGAAGRGDEGGGPDPETAGGVPHAPRQPGPGKSGDGRVVPAQGGTGHREGSLLASPTMATPADKDPARPALRQAARGNRFRSLARLFVTVLAISLALHLSAWVALARTPARQEATLEEIPDRFARLLVPERRAEPSRRREEKPAPEPRKEEAKLEGARKAEQDPAQAAARRAARAAEVARAVQSKGLLRVLGTLGPGGSGAVADAL